MLCYLSFIVLFSISFAYPTTITSNFSTPTPVSTPTYLQSASVKLLAEGQSMNYSTVITTTYTFKQQFDHSNPPPTVVFMIQTIKDNQTRTMITFQVRAQSISTTSVDIFFQDGSHPFSFNYLVEFKIGMMIFDPLKIPNLMTEQVVTSASVYTYLHFYNYSNLITSSAKLYTLFTKVLLDIQYAQDSTAFYKFKSMPYINNQTWFQIQVDAQFPRNSTSASVLVTLSLIIYYDISSNFTFAQGTLTQIKPYTLVPISNTTSFFIGIRSFKFEAGTNIQFVLQDDLRVFTLAMGSQATYPYFLLKKNAPVFPIDPALSINFNLTSIISFSTTNSTFQLVYQNIPSIGDVDASSFTINSTQINLESVDFSGSTIHLYFNFSKEIQNLPLKIELKWIKSQLEYVATTELMLTGSPLLKVYSILSQKQTLAKITYIIQFLFLVTFVMSLLSNKLPGLQMMSALQLCYYSLLSLDTSAPTIYPFTKMQYVSGYNIKFNIQQLGISSNYLSLGLSSNTLSNINLMLLPVILCVPISGILYLLFRSSKSYIYKPRFKQYSLGCLFEWIFVLFGFNIYNIYVSLMIQFEYIKEENAASIVSSIVIVLVSMTIIAIYVLKRQCYKQFIKQLNQSYKIGKLNVEKSRFVRMLYPLVAIAQMMLIALLLSSQLLVQYSLYMALAISLVVTVYVFVMIPYNQSLNNIRLFAHRILLNIMIILLLVIQKTLTSSVDFDSAMMYLPYSLLIVLMIIWGITITHTVYKLILWIKRPGIIDMKLYVEQKGEKIKPEVRVLLDDNALLWMPRNQFAIKIKKETNIRRGTDDKNQIDENVDHKREEYLKAAKMRQENNILYSI